MWCWILLTTTWISHQYTYMLSLPVPIPSQSTGLNSLCYIAASHKLSIGKDLDAGKDWRQEEKGTTEDEMAGWHHWLNGHEFEQTLGDGEGQGGLACSSPWGCKESDTTEQQQHIRWCFSFNSSNLLLPFLCLQVHSLLRHLCLCPVNRFINTIFLDSIYRC